MLRVVTGCGVAFKQMTLNFQFLHPFLLYILGIIGRLSLKMIIYMNTHGECKKSCIFAF